MKVVLNKYQKYILIYSLLILGFNINSEIFKIQLLVVFPVIVFLREIRYVLNNKKYFIGIFFLVFLSVILFVLRGSFVNASLPIYFLFFPLIASFYKEKYIGYKVHLFMLLLFLVFIIIQMLRGYGFNEMMHGRSRNMVGFYYFQYTIFYYIEKYRYTKKIEFWPAILSLIISFLAIGRSNIIVSILLLFVILIYKLNKANFSSKLKYSIISVFFLTIIFLMKNAVFSAIVYSFQRFQKVGIKSGPREWIAEIYLNKMKSSIDNFIIGFPLDHEAFELFDYNLHNSFFSLHYFFGGFALIIVYLFFKTIFFKKGKLIYKSFLCLLLIRGITDQVYFINFNDIIIFYLFYLINEKNSLIVDTTDIKDKIVKAN